MERRGLGDRERKRVAGAGRTAWGEFKLEVEQRRAIRKAYLALLERGGGKAPRGTVKALAERYGIDLSTVIAIGRGLGSYADLA